MLRLAVASALITVASALPTGSRAQDIVSLCEKARHPAVGAWSEFKWVGGRNDGATIRMSIVGRERREGADYLWMELVMRGYPMGPNRQPAGRPQRMISRLLVPGFGSGASPHAAIIKVGEMPAMEMPVGQSRMGTQGAPNLEACRNAKVIGWESVTVPAGTFRAIHIVNAAGHGDSWVAPDLPFALVKESGTAEGQNRQMVLIAHGTGARSQITERPRPWDPQLFMQMLTGGRNSRRP